MSTQQDYFPSKSSLDSNSSINGIRYSNQDEDSDQEALNE